ncbi:3-oxoacid CoA-transferase subunit B [soil metagenome]
MKFEDFTAKEIVARRVAKELRSGMLVNLGIGIPSLVANFIPSDVHVILDSENGLTGMGPSPTPDRTDLSLTDAGGTPSSALPGAAAFDSAMSFGLIRGGHVDVTILGALEVDSFGHLASWMIPGKLVPGMGGAMDLMCGAKRIIIAMMHTSKGESKIVQTCRLPLTSVRRVDLIVTELAVIEPTNEGLVLREFAPHISIAELRAATAAQLIVPEDVREMLF